MTWKTAQCALRGRGHRVAGTPCQDKVGTVCKDGLWIGALADGAGSAAHSHHGAQTVVDRICTLLEESFDALYAMEDASGARAWIVEDLRRALDHKAEELGVQLEDLASTLLFAAVKGERMLLGHLGDGVICYLRDGEMRTASKPDNGRFANETVFVTTPGAENALRLIKGNVGRIEGFCLMSDGSAASLYNRHTGSPMPVLAKLLRMRGVTSEMVFTAMLSQSLQESVCRATRDDCSLVLMSRSGQELSNEELAELLGLSLREHQRRRQLLRCRRILTLGANPVDIHRISREIHLKPKYARRYVNRLRAVGLVSVLGGGKIQTAR